MGTNNHVTGDIYLYILTQVNIITSVASYLPILSETQVNIITTPVSYLPVPAEAEVNTSHFPAHLTSQ